jgi:hypothetical protein
MTAVSVATSNNIKMEPWRRDILNAEAMVDQNNTESNANKMAWRWFCFMASKVRKSESHVHISDKISFHSKPFVYHIRKLKNRCMALILTWNWWLYLKTF